MSQLRQNPATKEWVIIAKERAQRPEDIGNRAPAKESPVPYEPGCPFCAGNESKTPRSIMEYRPYGTIPGTPGWWVRIVTNKYPALSPESNTGRLKETGFFRYMEGLGEHEVVIETPRHDMHLAVMEQTQVEEVFMAYRQRYQELSKDPRFEIVIIFKNHGQSAGTSLSHPHSQIIAAPVTPVHIRHRLQESMIYFDDEGRCVYCDMIAREKEAGTRIVMETENFICFEPFAARSPFETYILPKGHESSFGNISMELTKEFAFIARIVLAKLYVSLKNPDYNFVISSSPLKEPKDEYYHWHMKIIPRINAVAGFELGSGIYINTVIPEEAADFLRNTKA